MLQVRLASGLVEWEPELLLVAHRDGRVPPLTPVSFDGGATWTTAIAAVMRIEQQHVHEEPWDRFVPKGVSPLAHFTATVAPIVTVFFAAPVLFNVWSEVNKTYKPTQSRLTWVAFGFVVTALPLITLGVASLRDMKKRPHLRGVGRSWVAVVVGVALLVPLVMSLVRVLR